MKLEGHLWVVDLWASLTFSIAYLNFLKNNKFVIHFVIKKGKFSLRKKGTLILYFLCFRIFGMIIFFSHRDKYSCRSNNVLVS